MKTRLSLAVLILVILLSGGYAAFAASEASTQTENFAATGGIRLFVRNLTNTDPMSGTIGAAWVYTKLLTVAETQRIRNNTKWRY